MSASERLLSCALIIRMNRPVNAPLQISSGIQQCFHHGAIALLLLRASDVSDHFCNRFLTFQDSRLSGSDTAAADRFF